MRMVRNKFMEKHNLESLNEDDKDILKEIVQLHLENASKRVAEEAEAEPSHGTKEDSSLSEDSDVDTRRTQLSGPQPKRATKKTKAKVTYRRQSPRLSPRKAVAAAVNKRSSGRTLAKQSLNGSSPRRSSSRKLQKNKTAKQNLYKELLGTDYSDSESDTAKTKKPPKQVILARDGISGKSDADSEDTDTKPTKVLTDRKKRKRLSAEQVREAVLYHEEIVSPVKPAKFTVAKKEDTKKLPTVAVDRSRSCRWQRLSSGDIRAALLQTNTANSEQKNLVESDIEIITPDKSANEEIDSSRTEVGYTYKKPASGTSLIDLPQPKVLLRRLAQPIVIDSSTDFEIVSPVKQKPKVKHRLRSKQAFTSSEIKHVNSSKDVYELSSSEQNIHRPIVKCYDSDYTDDFEIVTPVNFDSKSRNLLKLRRKGCAKKNISDANSSHTSDVDDSPIKLPHSQRTSRRVIHDDDDDEDNDNLPVATSVEDITRDDDTAQILEPKRPVSYISSKKHKLEFQRSDSDSDENNLKIDWEPNEEATSGATNTKLNADCSSDESLPSHLLNQTHRNETGSGSANSFQYELADKNESLCKRKPLDEKKLTVVKKRKRQAMPSVDSTVNVKRKKSHTLANSCPKERVILQQLEKIARTCRAMPIGRAYNLAFGNCVTVQDRISKLKAMLQAVGMKGRPSMQKAKELKLQQEASELDVGDILCNKGRGHRNVFSLYATQNPLPSAKATSPIKNQRFFANLTDVVTSEEHDSDSPVKKAFATSQDRADNGVSDPLNQVLSGVCPLTEEADVI